MTDHPEGRTTFAVLRDRTFGPFLIGKIFSSCGNWVQQIAAAVLMFDLTGSALMVGAVSVVLFAGPLLLALWTGALTDRYDRRRLLIVARIITGAATGTLAATLLVADLEDLGGPYLLLGAAAVMSLGHALSAPAMQALVPALVPRRDLEPALALSASAPSIARTIGPAAGASLLLLGGPAAAFATAALAHALFVAVLIVISPAPLRLGTARIRLLGGVRYAFRTRTVGLLLIGLALLGFGTDPVLTLSPPLADQLGGGSQLVGLFASVFGVGAVIVIATFRQIRRLLSLRAVAITGFALVTVGLVAVAAAGSAHVAAAGFFINGSGFMLATVAIKTQIQWQVPEDLRGRVMALWSVAFVGSRPIAAPINGAIADLMSVTAALLLSAAVTLIAIAFMRAPRSDPDERDG